jgi:heme-degrading monooxygenase HmoA
MSIVTVTVFRYEAGARFRAFTNMGRWLRQPMTVPALQFGKLMGSGQNFGLMPDWSTYVFLGTWPDLDKARQFKQSSLFEQLKNGTESVSTLYLKPQRSHGQWSGQNPFEVDTDSLTRIDGDAPIAVLTRATIRARALPDFWRHVPQARQRLQEHRDQLLFGIGVGEVPVVQQCTISVWRSQAAVEQYAYRQSGHKEVVRLTRQRNWYAEELFARFSVVGAEGELFTEIANQLTDN